MENISKIIAVATLSLCLFLGSCCPARHISTSTQDSVRVEVRSRIEYVKDTVIREIPVISEKIVTRDTVSHLENYYAESDARINTDGTLFHSLATKPQREPIPIDRPVHYQDSIVYRDKLVKEVIHVERELTWWQKTQIKGFWLLSAAFIALFGVKIIPIIRKFI